MMRFIVGRDPKRTAIRIGVLLVLCFFTFKFVLLPIRVTGESMLPAYKDGSFRMVNRLAYKRSRPQRGDVVAIKLAGEHLMYMKRIIGLPGERVEIRSGTVYINDEPLEEPYIQLKRKPWHEDETRLRDDQYFVIGDNRSMSIDGHEHGAVMEHKIAGKVLF